VLTRAVTATCDAGQRRWTDRVILALAIERRRLVPDLVCDLAPTEATLDPLCVDRLEQRHRIESASRAFHVLYKTVVEDPADIINRFV
jgi:hypothetical protein